MALRVTIDDERCRGHGVCWSICPEVFELDGDGMGMVLRAEVPLQLTDAVQDARRQCPEQAIGVTVVAGD